MRRRLTIIALFGIAAAAPGFGQAADSTEKTLLAILAEIRGIHEDLRATESSQILLTELQMEQGVVSRAIERVDEVRSKLLELQQGEKMVTAEMKRTEDQLNQATDPGEQKHLADEVERHRSNLAALKSEEQLRSTALQEAQERLRNAQEALDSTQGELNDMIKRLNPGPK